MTTPNEIMFALYGLEASRRNGLCLLRWSEWKGKMSKIPRVGNEQKYVYDNTDIIRPYMQIPFLKSEASEQQLFYDSAMSEVRIVVEWNYK